MSFKSEAIIDLKDLLPFYAFQLDIDSYDNVIHDIDMYSGHLQHEYLFDMEDIDDDVEAHKEKFPLWSEEKLTSRIEYHIGDMPNEKRAEMKKELGNLIRTVLLPSGTAAALGKYGILLTDTIYTTPREYNFRSDSLDLHLEDATPSAGDISPEMHEIIETFLKEAPKSCDGYINLLPNTVEECTRLSIPHIFAILYKEGILEDTMDNIGDYIDEAQCIMKNYIAEALEIYLTEEYAEEFCGTQKTS